MQAHGEAWRQHRVIDRFFQILLERAGSNDMQHARPQVGRRKKWKSLGVVVMHVGEQKGRFDWLAAVFARATHQVVAQIDDARACIENEGMPTNLHFNAGRVAPVAQRSWAGHWVATPGTPYAHCKTFVHHLAAPPHRHASLHTAVQC